MSQPNQNNKPKGNVSSTRKGGRGRRYPRPDEEGSVYFVLNNRETKEKKPTVGAGNDALVPPGFEAFVRNQQPSVGGNDALVPPGFEAYVRNQQLLGRNDAIVPPGFEAVIRNQQLVGVGGNDASVPPGFEAVIRNQQAVGGNDALVPPGFEAFLRNQENSTQSQTIKCMLSSDMQSGNVVCPAGLGGFSSVNVLNETEGRAMRLPSIALDFKKIVNEVVKKVQPSPTDSVPQMQTRNVSTNVISDVEKQVTEAVERVQVVRPMDELEELRRPDDEAGTKRTWKVYNRKKLRGGPRTNQHGNEVEVRSMRLPNVISDVEKQVTEAVQKVHVVRPNDEAGTKRIWRVYNRKKLRGRPRLNQHVNEGKS